MAYHDAGGATGLGYDAAGDLKGNRQVTDGDEGKATTTRYEYQFLAGSYQQTASTAQREGTTATTKTWRDANGFVSNIEQVMGVGDERFNRAFVNDAQGNAIYVNQGAGHVGRIQNPGTYLGGWVGDSLNPGHVQRQLVANGEVLARYGDAPDSENPPANAGEAQKYVDTAEFRLNAAPLQLKGANLDAIAYTVVGGETLKDIARNVLGDAKLWWRIAEANGLAVSGDGQLAAGQTLRVPKLALNANSVETFQPYDPSRVTGSLDAVLPAPAGQGGGCGAVGKIIMVVVAVVVAVYAPQFLTQLGASGMFTTTGSLSALGGAVGGALGSVASQVAGNVLGIQDGFSWKSVALSAIGGGFASGLSNTQLLGGTDFGVSVARAAVGNVMTQGVAVVTGLQDHFDWRGVVASAAGAGVGWGMNNALGLTDTNGMRIAQPISPELIAKASLSGLAAGLTTAVAKGGRINVQQVAIDAFGNALGSSIAEAASGDPTRDPTSAFYENEMDRQSDAAFAAKQRVETYSFNTSYSSVGLRTSGRGGLGARFGEDAVFEWSGDVDAGIKTAAANPPAAAPVAGGSFIDTVNRMLAAQTGYGDAEYGAGAGWGFTQTGGGNQRPQVVRRGSGDAIAQLISDPWGLLGLGMTGGYDDVRASLNRYDIKKQIEDVRIRLGAGAGRSVPNVGSVIDGNGRVSLDYSPESLERFKIMENFENLRRQGIVELDANWKVTSVASGRQMFIDPMQIRFSQKTVGYVSRDGVNNLDTTGKTARVLPENLPAMEVVVMPDGRLTSIDNRRLTASQLYEAEKVKIVIWGSSDPLPAGVLGSDRFTWKGQYAETWGEAVLMRMWDQGKEFREAFSEPPRVSRRPVGLSQAGVACCSRRR
ncbi:LysM peptidoglycan-binding domain-containing protein [Acidovorax sp. NCPPB 2350]|nr:LysM peptidoglycan-binding domain-containing protein [Acidovorax sp. NCPPB 2350]